MRFSRDETLQIRTLLGGPGTQIACPRCHGLLTTSHPVDGLDGPTFFVGCKACSRKAVIADVTGMWRPGPRG